MTQVIIEEFWQRER